MTPETRTELRRLVSDLCDGELTDAGQARLEELLAQPDGRRLYLEYVDLHARLLTHPPVGGAPLPATTAAPVGVAGEATAPRRRRRASQSIRYTLVAAATLAASLLVQVLWWHPKPDATRGPAPEMAARAEPVYVATLTQAVDCSWDGAGPARRVGSRLLPGDLRLTAGLARIRFDG